MRIGMTEIGSKAKNGETADIGIEKTKETAGQGGAAVPEAAFSFGNAAAEPLPSLAEIADERERLAEKRERRHVVSLSLLLVLLIALAAVLVGLLTGFLPI